MREELDLSYTLPGDNPQPCYFMNGACRNCRTEYSLKIPKGRSIPLPHTAVKCRNCGCDTVVAA